MTGGPLRPPDDSLLDAVLYAPESEEALLGSCLLDVEQFALVRTRVRSADFATRDLGVLYGLMEAMADRGEMPLWQAVKDELSRLRPDHERGGLALLVRMAEVMENTPTAVHGLHHARIVLHARMRRMLRDAATLVVNLARLPDIDADTAVRLALDEIGKIPRTVRSAPVVLTGAEMAAVARRVIAGETGAVIPFGWRDLDRLVTGGARPGQLILVGGRPGAGKSSFLRDTARSFARAGHVLFASNEMDEAGIAARDLAAATGVSLVDVLEGKVTGEERAALEDATREMGRLALTTYVDGGMTTANLRARALELHSRVGLVAVVVDYLQRMADPGRTTLERVGATVRGLKALAMELRVPLVVGSQLNRGGERTDHDRPPTLIDLRDSGELEQEADVVLLLHRLSYYYPTEQTWRSAGKTTRYPAGEADLWIAKQRQGQSGVSVTLTWVAKLATFRDFFGGDEVW